MKGPPFPFQVSELRIERALAARSVKINEDKALRSDMRMNWEEALI